MGRNGVDKHANCHFECESNFQLTARLSPVLSWLWKELNRISLYVRSELCKAYPFSKATIQNMILTSWLSPTLRTGINRN